MTIGLFKEKTIMLLYQYYCFFILKKIRIIPVSNRTKSDIEFLKTNILNYQHDLTNVTFHSQDLYHIENCTVLQS